MAGAWRSQVQFSGGTFAAMKDLEFMYVFNAGCRYLFHTTKAPARLDDNGTAFESTITYEAFDRSGNPVAGGGDATGHGVRIDFRPDHQD